MVELLSGRQDSNLRPPGPKPGAMTGLRYAPKKNFACAAWGRFGGRISVPLLQAKSVGGSLMGKFEKIFPVSEARLR
jgi:hypothetical protein